MAERGGEVKRRAHVVSRSDVCLDQNGSEQQCPRQRAGGCQCCVNMCESVCVVRVCVRV